MSHLDREDVDSDGILDWRYTRERHTSFASQRLAFALCFLGTNLLRDVYHMPSYNSWPSDPSAQAKRFTACSQFFKAIASQTLWDRVALPVSAVQPVPLPMERHAMHPFNKAPPNNYTTLSQAKYHLPES